MPEGSPGEVLPDDGAPGAPGRSPGRSPGLREVIIVAVLVLVAVFAVEILSSLLPPVREAFRGFPVTIVALVVGTVGLLLWIGLRRPRR